MQRPAGSQEMGKGGMGEVARPGLKHYDEALALLGESLLVEWERWPVRV